MLQFKDGVDNCDIAAELMFALGVAAELHWKLFGRAMVVTSMRDGQHMQGSLHGKGRAADLRSDDSSAVVVDAWVAQMKERLYLYGFDVVNETSPVHVHIEYDPKAGRVFPVVPSPKPADAVQAAQV